MNKNLYNRKAKLPETLKKHLEDSFNAVTADSNVEGFNRNQDLRNDGFVTYQQIKRIKNWFDTFNGNKEDAPFILNGGDYMSNWITTTIDHMRNNTHTNQEVKDVMPEDINDQLVDDMGWLSNMNRDAKSHSGYNDDIKITESLKRINEIMKKLI